MGSERHGSGEKRLPETRRPGLITTVPQPTHGLVKEDTLGGILFLRLKASHLRPKHRLFNCSHYALLRAARSIKSFLISSKSAKRGAAGFLATHDHQQATR
jgi:hypothetical protein